MVTIAKSQHIKSRRRNRTSRRGLRTGDDVLRSRVLQLLRKELAFVPNREFLTQGLAGDSQDGLVPPADLRSSNRGVEFPHGFPGYLARLCEQEPLTAPDEKDFFRRLNYLKFRANQYRSRLDPECPDRETIQKVVQLLGEARAIRDHLIKSNMRLVVSIARKFVSPQTPLDDLLGEGVLALMSAVEKFDYDRGFRFSTYAYRSISRSLSRSVRRRRTRVSRLGESDKQVVASLEDTSRSGWTDLQEQRHYALGAHRKKRTCRQLAERLGVSKERVRQIEKRPIAKIQGMAAAAGVVDKQGS